MDKTNVWLFPIGREVLVTDQIGGVPVDCCNLPAYAEQRLEKLTGSTSVLYDFNSWEEATDFANKLHTEKLKSDGWTIRYDSYAGRFVEAEHEIENGDRKIDYFDADDDQVDHYDDDEDDAEPDYFSCIGCGATFSFNPGTNCPRCTGASINPEYF